MGCANNCHTLFTHSTKDSFLENLRLNATEESLLRKTRDEIQRVIIKGFELQRKAIQSSQIKYELPTPRFYTQGSFAYRTIIDPAYPPEQQADLDYGIYLPFENLLADRKPRETAKTYFALIESILREYGKWNLKRKNTCIRVILKGGRAHIDLPLYGVPASEFNKVVEAKAILKFNQRTEDSSALDRLDPTCVHLAKNDGSWQPSDPRVIREWIDSSCASHGVSNQIRSVCKYLKAWRDEKWNNGGGPSSIFLLAVTIHNYHHTSGHHHELLKNIIDVLPDSLSRPVLVPSPIPGNEYHQEDLRERLDEALKLEFKEAFSNLKFTYDVAMTTSNSQIANKTLREIFGDRLPFDPDRIVNNTTPPPSNKVTNTRASIAPLAMGTESAGG